VIHSPTSLLKTFAPVMKYGVLFVTTALASQGLGVVFPDISNPAVDCGDYLSSLLHEVVNAAAYEEKSLLTDEMMQAISVYSICCEILIRRIPNR
jgi:hypothetical protein